MEFLLKVINTYRVSTEHEALELREKIRKESNGELTAFSYTVKEVKQKGEVIDTYIVCKATIEFNKEKEAERHVQVTYEDI